MKTHMEIGKYMENPLKCIELYVKWLGVGNGWEMVGVNPTYVLRSGAFLAGAFLFLKSRPLFIKSVFCVFFMIKPPFL